MTLRYEPAGDGDAAAIAELHARSWQDAYRGILPDAYLDGDILAERTAVWAKRFADRDGTLTVVARDTAGELAGFAHSMIDDDPEWGTLLDNLHVRPSSKRSGIGRRLLVETVVRLQDGDSAARLHLWVLEANEPARRFYRSMGAEETGRDFWDEGGVLLPVLRCSWGSLDALAAPLRPGPSS